jgi:hypothetical protein
MEFPHPFQNRREREVDAAVMEAALAGAVDIRDSLAAEEPAPYALPLGKTPRGIEPVDYAERVGATAQELLGALGCHDVEVDYHITQFTATIKPRRQLMPLKRPDDSQGARVMFRHKTKIID